MTASSKKKTPNVCDKNIKKLIKFFKFEFKKEKKDGNTK